MGVAYTGYPGKHKENIRPAGNHPQPQTNPQESGVTHDKGLSEVPFFQSALPRSRGCLLLLLPLKLTYLRPTMEQRVNLII